MIDDAQYAPTAPQPAATRDGVPLAPLAGGFLPPYTERLPLLAGLPVPTPEATWQIGRASCRERV